MRIRWANLTLLILAGALAAIGIGRPEGLSSAIRAVRSIGSPDPHETAVMDLAALGFLVLGVVCVVRLLATARNRGK